MNGGVTIERWLVSKNNAGVLPAGIQVFSCPGGNCKKGIAFPTSAVEGMFVFYGDDRVSVDPSATPTVQNLRMGMYYARKGNGVVTEILKIAGEKISCGSNFLSGVAVAPTLGTGEVGRGMFTCSTKNTLYTLQAQIESNRTRQEFAENKKMTIIGQYDTSVNPACDDCTDPTVCREIVCGIVQSLNGELGTGDFPAFRSEKSPAKFFVYNKFDDTFCLSGVTSACGDCNSFTGIKGISIQGQDHIFGNTLNSATTSHITQLKTLIENIDCSFETGQGKAFLGQGTINSACVDIKLIVNSCIGVRLINADGTYLEPCTTTENTFSKVGGKICVDCGSASTTTTTYDCSIGWYGELAEENCDCNGKSDIPVTYYPTHVTLTPLDGFTDFVSEIVTSAAVPYGWGVQLWEEQYKSEVKPGFHDTEWRTEGIYDRVHPLARSKNVDLACDTGYCVLSFTTAPYGQEAYGFGLEGKAYVRTVIPIPQQDTTTITDLLADLNGLKNANNCYGITDFSCTADPTPGAPTPSVTPSRYSTPSVTRSISATITVTRTSSVTTSISVTRSRTASLSVSA